MEKCFRRHFHCRQSHQLLFPQYSASFQTILTLTNISACTAFETSHIHIMICCSRSYRRSLNFAILYMFRCGSLNHPLYIYAAMILNHPSMFWGWCSNIGCCHPSSNGCLIICSFCVQI